MKKSILLYLLCCCSFMATAQKYQVFGDVGISTLLFRTTNFSVTADRVYGRHFGLGLGAQTVTATIQYPLDNSATTLKTSLFADTRGYFHIGRSLIFLYADFGISLYHAAGLKGLEEPHDDGFYFGLGLGYSYPINARGMGPYIAFRIATDIYGVTDYSATTGQAYKSGKLEGDGFFALGFKF